MKPVIVRLLPCLAALALAACASAPLTETRYRLPEPAPLSAAQPLRRQHSAGMAGGAGAASGQVPLL